MTQSKPQSRPQSNPAHHHNRWLLLIALYKFLQALLIASIGFGAIHLLGKDVADELFNLADRLHFNSEGRLVDFILEKAELLNDPILRRIGAAAFFYAALSLAEGIGLYLEKAWGEYLTLFITASFLPWELIEVIHRLTLIRVSLLTINVLVFLYLLRLVTDRSQKRAQAGQTGA
jgi:uncharacterized membrane protein (DUF2068 family)